MVPIPNETSVNSPIIKRSVVSLKPAPDNNINLIRPPSPRKQSISPHDSHSLSTATMKNDSSSFKRKYLIVEQHPSGGVKINGRSSISFLKALCNYRAPGGKINILPLQTSSIDNAAYIGMNSIVSLSNNYKCFDHSENWFCSKFIPLCYIISNAAMQGWQFDNVVISETVGWPALSFKKGKTFNKNKHSHKVNCLTFSMPISKDPQFKPPVFGQPIASLDYHKTRNRLPSTLNKLFDHLSQSESLIKKGLFRYNSKPMIIQQLKNAIDRGEDINLHLFDVYATATLLKD